MKLRRGLREHLRGMGPYCVTVYVYLLLEADYGERPGTVETTTAVIAEACNISTGSVSNALKKLQDDYLKIERSARGTTIEILRWEPGERSPRERQRSPHERSTLPERSPHERQRSPHERSPGPEIEPKPLKAETVSDIGPEIALSEEVKNTSVSSLRSDTDAARARPEEPDKPVFGKPLPPPPIVPFGQFGRCKLTLLEHEKLERLIGREATVDYIDRFDLFVEEAPEAKASGVRRCDRKAYPTILNWFRRDQEQRQARSTQPGAAHARDRTRQRQEANRQTRLDYLKRHGIAAGSDFPLADGGASGGVLDLRREDYRAED